MSAALAQPATSPAENTAAVQSFRETVESIIVAFVLAFLFRAFVAEAFVIPTGSMAPTLMGAHKDLVCEHCGEPYQASASSEFNSNTGAQKDAITIASTCATCRGLNAYDFRGNPNHASFSGDRILVSKFDYLFKNPKRWDVFVFKYPTEAHMNYIKRLIGLPGESLLIQDGDIYTRSADATEWTIARKPPTKIRAMQQIVSDTKHQATVLVQQGWPSLWQPLPNTDANGAADQSAWKVSHGAENWQAELAASSQPQWLRYYHKFVDDAGWQQVLSGGKLQVPDAHSSRLITDYLAYNSSYEWRRDQIYAGQQLDRLRTEVTSENRAINIAEEHGLRLDGRHGYDGHDNDGYHWVGDLAGEFELEITSDNGTLLLDLVEFGIHLRCSVNVADGVATLDALDSAGPVKLFGDVDSVRGQTSIRGPGKYRVALANFDDQLVLWVNRQVVQFDRPAEYDSRLVRMGSARRPYWSESDPLDAAPVGIGGQDIAMRVERALVYRDIYYISEQNAAFTSEYSDYDLGRLNQLIAAIPDNVLRGQMRTASNVISAVYSNPQWWAETNLFEQRGQLEFQLEDDQYFPMGDNSSHSSDARAWLGHNYVEQKYLLGKALLVFWPHTWNTPVPFTPNFSRMGLIR